MSSKSKSRGRHLKAADSHLLFPLAAAFLLSANLLGQTGGATYMIHGRVSLPNGSNASRVIVEVSGQTGFSRRVMTDDAGQYSINDVPRGRFFIVASNPAEPEQYSDRAEIELTRVSPPQVPVNIYLRAGARVTSGKEAASAGVSTAEASQRVPRAAQKEYERGIKLGESRQFEKALESFNRAIELFPEYFQALAQRGHLRVSMGQITEAEKDFAVALDHDPQYEPALRGIGICRIREGKFSEALQYLEPAVAKEPRDSAAYLFLGFAYASLDRREEARAALLKALSIDAAGSVRAHVHLANLDLKENRNQAAAAELEKYLAAVPNAPDADKLRALLAWIKQQPSRE